jgi:mRNA interferase YafQ
MKQYDVTFTKTFAKDLKKAKKRGCDLRLLDEIVDNLKFGISLPAKNKDHALAGQWKGYRECHIKPDWLLIYKYDNNVLVLTLSRTGSHSDLDLA